MKWYELARSRMKELGITQEKLAEELGMTQGGIGHWLRGSRHPSPADCRYSLKIRQAHVPSGHPRSEVRCRTVPETRKRLLNC